VENFFVTNITCITTVYEQLATLGSMDWAFGIQSKCKISWLAQYYAVSTYLSNSACDIRPENPHSVHHSFRASTPSLVHTPEATTNVDDITDSRLNGHRTPSGECWRHYGDINAL